MNNKNVCSLEKEDESTKRKRKPGKIEFVKEKTLCMIDCDNHWLCSNQEMEKLSTWTDFLHQDLCYGQIGSWEKPMLLFL